MGPFWDLSMGPSQLTALQEVPGKKSRYHRYQSAWAWVTLNGGRRNNGSLCIFPGKKRSCQSLTSHLQHTFLWANNHFGMVKPQLINWSDRNYVSKEPQPPFVGTFCGHKVKFQRNLTSCILAHSVSCTQRTMNRACGPKKVAIHLESPWSKQVILRLETWSIKPGWSGHHRKINPKPSIFWW